MKKQINPFNYKTPLYSLCAASLMFIGCGDSATGPEPEPNVSSVSENSSSSDEVSSPAESEVKLMTLEKSIYDHEVYVNLESQEEQAIEVAQWDVNIGRESVVLNTGHMGGGIWLDKDFADVSEADIPTEESDWNAYSVNEQLDYTNDGTYLVRQLGEFNHATQSYGENTYYKFKLTYDFRSHTAGVLQGSLGSEDTTVVEAFGHYSLQNKEEVTLDTPENWDLKFTTYQAVLEGGETYLVRGALLLEGTEVALDSVSVWADVSNSADYEFSSKKDAIGHAWKYFEDGSFQLEEDWIYILKTSDDRVYKIKFLNFYNADKVRGYPQFQFVEIE